MKALSALKFGDTWSKQKLIRNDKKEIVCITQELSYDPLLAELMFSITYNSEAIFYTEIKIDIVKEVLFKPDKLFDLSDLTDEIPF